MFSSMVVSDFLFDRNKCEISVTFIDIWNRGLKQLLLSRHGVNSIPELQLMANSGIRIDYLKKNGFEKFGIVKF